MRDHFAVVITGNKNYSSVLDSKDQVDFYVFRTKLYNTAIKTFKLQKTKDFKFDLVTGFPTIQIRSWIQIMAAKVTKLI